METANFLMPKQRKISQEEIDVLLKKHNLSSVYKLPFIKIKDPSLSDMKVSETDVIEIERNSFAGKNYYYRVVIK